MKTTVTARFVINFVARTITGSEASFKKAGKGFGPEYEELTEKIAKHPDFELVVETSKKSTTAKRTYNGLNFKFMEEYFLTQKNTVALVNEYINNRKIARATGRSEFPFTKKWFLNKFSTEETPFDMEEAKEKIETVLRAEASGTNEKLATTRSEMTKKIKKELNPERKQNSNIIDICKAS